MFLILGKRPLPIGGVTIHVERLLHYLSANNVSFEYLDLKKNSKQQIIMNIIMKKNIHLHSSNVYLRFLLTIFGKLTCKRIDLTLHGDLGRYESKIKNILDLLAIKLANKPVLLNNSSFNKAYKLNKNAFLGSSFIPPFSNSQNLDDSLMQTIHLMKKKIDFLFCTNAFNLAYDKNGQEIYGIFELIDIFTEQSKLGLIVSDPSGAYLREINRKEFNIPENIIIIPFPHSFYRIIELCDGTIRNTSTDGDSISVKESLFLEKNTFCTNVVSRPKETITYKKGELDSLLKNYCSVRKMNLKSTFKKQVESSLSQVLDLYMK
ncbi:hypothetical protein GCM10007103_29140 [Salinimicrobium marinum]|uniref:Uncharacterized protein n=1 Tax=Salinimicrobium marinum TaxID=680283 RepID=A0A918SKH2_9FLAO|nr:hypothetical protein [Salinimicrobium marinum]GHA46208.1 hypothetical protein GCM10007103_29140 [Salinimicrobium marinum]